MDDYRSQFAAVMKEAADRVVLPQKRVPIERDEDALRSDYRRMVAEVNRATEVELERALLGV